MAVVDDLGAVMIIAFFYSGELATWALVGAAISLGVLLIFIAAAFVTPTPDVVNLLMFALPTIVLYLLGVAAAALVLRSKKKQEQQEDQSEE